jgi:PilZ domain
MDTSQSPSQRAETADISKSGLRIICDLPLPIGTPVEIFLRMPEEVMGEAPHEWCCRGRVVRVSDDDAGRDADGDHPTRSIAVKFHYYEVLQRDVATVGGSTRDAAPRGRRQ